MKDKVAFQFLALVAFGLAVGFLSGVITRRTIHPQIVEVVHTDTLIIHDTVRVDRPVYISQRIVDSIPVPFFVTDTLRLHDTTVIMLPRLQREYSDTLYHAWVSGYAPALDSIQIFRKERIVEVTKTVQPAPKHWHLGVSAGYGMTLSEEAVRLSPYVGIGISYSILSF